MTVVEAVGATIAAAGVRAAAAEEVDATGGPGLTSAAAAGVVATDRFPSCVAG